METNEGELIARGDGGGGELLSPLGYFLSAFSLFLIWIIGTTGNFLVFLLVFKNKKVSPSPVSKRTLMWFNAGGQMLKVTRKQWMAPCKFYDLPKSSVHVNSIRNEAGTTGEICLTAEIWKSFSLLWQRRIKFFPSTVHPFRNPKLRKVKFPFQDVSLNFKFVELGPLLLKPIPFPFLQLILCKYLQLTFNCQKQPHPSTLPIKSVSPCSVSQCNGGIVFLFRVTN